VRLLIRFLLFVVVFGVAVVLIRKARKSIEE
jgi:hypothetical protein